MATKLYENNKQMIKRFEKQWLDEAESDFDDISQVRRAPIQPKTVSMKLFLTYNIPINFIKEVKDRLSMNKISDDEKIQEILSEYLNALAYDQYDDPFKNFDDFVDWLNENEVYDMNWLERNKAENYDFQGEEENERLKDEEEAERFYRKNGY